MIIVGMRPEAQPQDDGCSTFDKYRSEQSVSVGPQGSYLQAKMQMPTVDEMDEMRIRDAQRFGGNYARGVRFDLEEQPGGSTFCRGEVLSE